MTDFDDILNHATHRLRVDPELQLEVRRELETHLEDAAAEYQQAGDSPEIAQANAVKALGDPDALANQLWQANRRRVRLRYWIRWLVRVSVVPAALAVLAWLLIPSMTVAGQYKTLLGGMSIPGSGPFEQYSQNRLKSRMTPDQRLIFFGDEKAGSEIDRWRAVRDAWPDEKMYQAMFIDTLMAHRRDAIANGDSQAMEQVMAELDRGRELDADNGRYDLIEACMYMSQAGKVEEDKSRQVLIYRPRDDQLVPSYPRLFTEPPNEQMLQAGLAALKRAAAKPYIRGYEVPMLRHRIAQLPASRFLQDYVLRIEASISMLLPALGSYRSLTRTVVAEAIRQADERQVDAAMAMLDDLRSVHKKVAADSQTFINILVDMNVWATERTARKHIGQAAGHEQLVEQARQQHEDLTRWWHEMQQAGRRQTDDFVPRAGVLMGAAMPALAGYNADISPFRLAEYNMADRVAMMWATLLLVALSLGCSLLTLTTMLRLRGQGSGGAAVLQQERPILLWIGTRRLVCVLLIGLGVPVVGMAALAGLPMGMRQYGLNHVPWVVGIYPMVTSLSLSLLWLGGIASLRKRAGELGMDVPHARPWWLTGLLLLLPAAFLWPMAMMYWAFSGHALDWLHWLAFIFVMSAVWLAVLLELSWLRGRQDGGHIMWGAAKRGGLLTAGLAGVIGGSVYWTGHPRDAGVFLALAIGLSVLCGMISGWLWAVLRDGPAVGFARSAIRSMGLIFAAAALVLVITVGPMLDWRERVLVGQLVAQSPVWWDLEVEHSHAKYLRERLAGDEPIVGQAGD